MVGKPWQTSWLDSGSIFAGRQGMCSLLSVTRLRPRLPCLTTAKPSPYGQQGRAPTNPDWPDPALSPRVGGDMRHLLPPAGHRDRRGYIFFLYQTFAASSRGLLDCNNDLFWPQRARPTYGGKVSSFLAPSSPAARTVGHAVGLWEQGPEQIREFLFLSSTLQEKRHHTSPDHPSGLYFSDPMMDNKR